MTTRGLRSPIRYFTLGLIPSMTRDALLAIGYIPGMINVQFTPVHFMYALGGVILSHPFEVARVLIQYDVYNTKSGIFGKSLSTIRSIYSNEGLSGLYRGLIPRALRHVPLLMTAATVSHSHIFKNRFQ